MFGDCNTRTTPTNKNVHFGSIECWINKEEIANIFSIPKIEEMILHITYNSRDGHYIFHTKDREVQFNNDEMGIPYIDSQKIQDMVFVKTAWEKLKGSPIKRSPQPNLILNPMERLAIHKRETSNQWKTTP